MLRRGPQFWLLGLLVTACAPTGPLPRPALANFVLAPAEPVRTPDAAGVSSLERIKRPTPSPAATPGPGLPSPPPPASSGGGGSGPAAPPPATGSTLVLANGQVIDLPAGAEVPLPAGLTGEATLLVPGRVPATIELPAGGPPIPALHPRDATVVGLPTGSAGLTGSVAPPGEAGVAVQFVSARRGPLPGTVTALGGAYVLNVGLDAADEGLLVARDATEYPRLGLARVSLAPGDQLTPPNLALVDPDPTPVDPPVPPAGLAITAAGLFVLEGTGAAAHRVSLLAVPGDRLPAYDLPGFTLGASFTAAAPDGLSASEASGPPGNLPTFLDPPDLAATARPVAGARLSWGGAPGASLYTVRVGRQLSPEPPLWEAATTQASVTVPAGLALDGQPLLLQIDAWDAPEVNLYSVASLRRLRVPATPTGPSGRHAVALKNYAP